MGRRKLLSVADFPLVGGSPCLDLVNTTGARASRTPRERLGTYADLLVWCRRAGVLKPSQADRLGARAAELPSEAQATLERVRRLREQLYRLFRAVAEGAEPSPDVVTQLGEWWRADRSRRELVSRGGVFELRLLADRDELDAMLWPVVSSAVELLTSGRLAQLKRCGECDWLFLDESKNRSRTWCKKDCGARARARRHYRSTRGDKPA